MNSIKLDLAKEIESPKEKNISMPHNPMSDEFKKFLQDDEEVDRVLQESLDLLD
jgi:hypothetical protein